MSRKDRTVIKGESMKRLRRERETETEGKRRWKREKEGPGK